MNNSVQEALQTFLSNDNNTRKSAEQYIENLYNENKSECLNFFLEGLQLPQQELASLSALYLKKKYFGDVAAAKEIPEDKYTEIIRIVQATINGNKSKLFLQRCADILINAYIFKDYYIDLLQYVFSLNTNANTPIKETIMYFIEVLCEITFEDELLMKFSNDFTNIFDHYLKDPDINVRVAALKSTAIFISSISNEEFVLSLSSVLPVLIQTLIEGIKASEDIGIKALDSISDLIEAHPKVIKPYIENLIQLITEIMSQQSFEHALRCSALNALQAICRCQPVGVRKSDVFKSKTCVVLFQMLTEVEDIPLLEWDQEKETQVISKNDPESAVVEALPSLTESLGSKYLLPIFIPLIAQAVSSNAWQNKYAGLMAIGMLCDGAAETYKSELPNILNLVFPCFEHDNPRVVWATFTAVALLCSEFQPDIQQTFHAIIIQNIIKYMIQSTSLRVQCRAISTIVNFSKPLVDNEEDAQILNNYSSQLLQNLIQIFDKALTTQNYQLQEEILNALSIIAATIGNEFSQYYNAIIPYLKQLLFNLPTETTQQQTIKVLTIECIGFLVSAIKENTQQFMGDISSIMNALISLQNSGLSQDDQQIPAILTVYTNFAQALGPNFEVYLPQIFDRVIQAAETEVEFILQDELESKDDRLDNEHMVKASVDLKILGGKKTLAVNTSLLEQKITGSQTLFALAEFLGKSFFQYIPRTSQTVEKLINYKYSKEVRRNMLKLVNKLVMACGHEANVVELLHKFLPAFIKEATAFLDVSNDQETFIILEEISKNIKILTTPSIDQGIINELLAVITRAAKLAETEKAAVLKEFKNYGEVDQEKEDEFKEEYEEFNDLLQITMEIHGALIKLYKHNIEQYIASELSPIYYKILTNKSSTENELLYAICFFDDLLDNCSEQSFLAAYSTIIQNYLDIPQNSNTSIIQSIVWGLGSFAKRCPQDIFNEKYPQVCNYLAQLVNLPDAFSEDRAESTECAIGALGKLSLYQYHGDAISNEILLKFLKHMPLKTEPEEAQDINKLFLREVLAKNPILINESTNVDIQRIIRDIQTIVVNQPEDEILDDEGKTLLQQLI